MDNATKQMFLDICKELGIQCTLLSKDWVFMLEKDGVTRFFVGSKSPLNDHALGKIIDDKYALYEVLKEKGLPVAEYRIVYSERVKEDYAVGCNTFQYVIDYYNQNNCDIVLKPNNGTCGTDVYRINSISELDRIYHQLTNRYDSINMGPFYHIQNEYRFIVLDGEIKSAYKKNRPVVYGNGKDSIRELLIQFNKDYFENLLEDSKYDKVLDIGEEFEYNWKYNLTQGSIASLITDSFLKEELERIALKAANSIGLRFGSVDIIVTDNDEYLILEMNSGVMLYEKIKPLYKEVILKMFN